MLIGFWSFGLEPGPALLLTERRLGHSQAIDTTPVLKGENGLQGCPRPPSLPAGELEKIVGGATSGRFFATPT